jgi:RND superfamily putative drug exporter
VNALALPGWRRAVERTAAGEESGFWYRLSQAVMRHAGIVAAACTALLLLLGLPFLNVRFTQVDARVLPRDASAREVHEELLDEFPPSRATPISVVADEGDASEGAMRGLAAELRGVDGVVAVSRPQRVENLWRVDVISGSGDALDDQSRDTVEAIRALDTPFDVRVGGETARFLDQRSSLGSHLVVALLFLALTTLLILFAMTGSVVLPIKTLIINLLTVSAVFGVLVLVFQDGRLESVLDYESLGALDMTQPILIAFVAFALSTDYGVFLLTRIKEAYDSGLSNTEAVARGLERTGRIVTAAAVLFCIALAAFSTSKIVIIKTIGVGAVFGVLLDATVVRGLLVPSLMKLLGDWNWWAPAPLRRLHDRFGLHESS